MIDSIIMYAAEGNRHSICRAANRIGTPDAYLAAIAALSAVDGDSYLICDGESLSLQTATTLWESGYDPAEIPAILAGADEAISIAAAPSIAVAALVRWFTPESAL